MGAEKYTVDIGANISQAEGKLNDLETKIKNLSNTKVDIDVSIKGLTDTKINKLQSLNSELERLQNLAKGITVTPTINVSGSGTKKNATQSVQSFLTAQQKMATSAAKLQQKQLQTQVESYQKLSLPKQNLENSYRQTEIYYKKYEDLYKRSLTQKLSDSEISEMSTLHDNWTASIEKTKNEYKMLEIEYGKPASFTQKYNKIHSVESYMKANTKALKKYGDEFNYLISKYKNATKLGLSEADEEFAELKSNISLEGLEGKGFGSVFSGMVSKFTQWFSISQVIMKGIEKVSSAINELKEVDTILTEISKTSDLTDSQIKTLGEKSFDEASKYGQKASDYLTGVQEMSRAGYENATGMARLATLAQSAGDMTAELANEYLIASDAAYGYGGDIEKLNALLDSQNQVTNRNAINMTELASATKIVASQASQAGISEAELTAAVGTMMAVTQQGGEMSSRAFKAILMNLQKVSGEVDGEIIDEESMEKVEKRLHSVGVATEVVVDGVAKLRDPIEILEELSEVYNSLPDDSAQKAGIISDLGGKQRGGQLAALLGNWETYEKILSDYQDAEGSAALEAEKTAQSWQGSLNRLSNTWTELVSNFANSDGITIGINTLNDALSVIDDSIEKIGSLQTMGLGLGLFQGLKGSGKPDKYRIWIHKEYVYATGEFSGDVYELCMT